MKIIGGASHKRGISFETEKFKVAVDYSKKVTISENLVDKIDNKECENTFLKVNKRLLKFFNNIPFLRELFEINVISIKGDGEELIISYIINIMFISLFSSIFKDTSILSDIFTILGVLLLLKIYCHKTKISGLHCAEHKASNCYLNDKEITIYNIKREKGFSLYCSVNKYTYIIIVYLFFRYLGLIKFTCIMLSIMVGGELFNITQNHKKIFIPFIFIGGIFQYMFFLGNPSRKQMEMAKLALDELIKLEKFSHI